jgi:hypothetical protein
MFVYMVEAGMVTSRRIRQPGPVFANGPKLDELEPTPCISAGILL